MSWYAAQNTTDKILRCQQPAKIDVYREQNYTLLNNYSTRETCKVQ